MQQISARLLPSLHMDVTSSGWTAARADGGQRRWRAARAAKSAARVQTKSSEFYANLQPASGPCSRFLHASCHCTMDAHSRFVNASRVCDRRSSIASACVGCGVTAHVPFGLRTGDSKSVRALAEAVSPKDRSCLR